MISQTAEYALRAMVSLGQQPTEPRAAESLSESTCVPVPYLHKILRELANAKLLRIRRGRHGGFTLARPPEQMHLLDVIDAIAPIPRIDRCPLGHHQHDRQLCALHSLLDQANQTIRGQFQNTTIADMLHATAERPPLCNSAPPGPSTFPV